MIKEGLIIDQPNRERIAKLLRFTSSRSQGPNDVVSLDEYLARMPEGQRQIYYLGGPDFASVVKSPNLEIFRRRGIEVLFLTDPIDEFAITSLISYQGKTLTSIDSAELDLPDSPEQEAATPESPEPSAAKESGFPHVLDLFRAALGNRVKEVRESKRLTDSPCCLVNAEGGPSTQMQRLLKLANKDFPEVSRILEINPSAPLVRRLCNLAANADHDAFIRECALAALDQRHDPGGGHARPRGPGLARPVVHGRGRRQALAVDPLMRLGHQYGSKHEARRPEDPVASPRVSNGRRRGRGRADGLSHPADDLVGMARQPQPPWSQLK